MLAGKAAVRTALLPPTTTTMKQPNVVAALAKMYKTFLHSTSSAHSTRTLASLTQSSHKLITAQHPQQQQQQWRNLSIGRSASQAAGQSGARKSDGAEANKEEIERLVLQHQVKGVSMPVRAEFVRDKPLSTKDLESIDIRVYHRKPVTISDHVAYRSVKLLRFFADTFFRKRYVHRAIVLETVAGVPGMVAGMLCHMRSLRRMQHDNGWIEKLLHEAENERMHLMIWMKVTEPTVPERLLVTFVQGLFFNAYMLYYLLFPRTAHRFVGYLEEEAIVSYNAFAKEVLNGNIRNTPAPRIAIDYYNLETEAKLLDVVYAVRADEAAHRDANHNFADRIDDHKENLSPQPKRGEPKPAEKSVEEKSVEEKSVDDVKQP